MKINNELLLMKQLKILFTEGEKFHLVFETDEATKQACARLRYRLPANALIIKKRNKNKLIIGARIEAVPYSMIDVFKVIRDTLMSQELKLEF